MTLIRGGKADIQLPQLSAQKILLNTFNVSVVIPTYETITALDLILPIEGTYLVYGNILGNVAFSANGPAGLSCRLFDVTNNTPISASLREIVNMPTITLEAENSLGFSTLVTVKKRTQISLQVTRNFTGATYTIASIGSFVNGHETVMGFVQVVN